MAKLTKKTSLGRSTIKGSGLRKKKSDAAPGGDTPTGSELEATTGALSTDTGGAPAVADAETGKPLTNLDALIEQIKEAHEDTKHAATSIVVAAQHAGELLAEAKDKLEEGTKFTKWIEDNCGFSWRTGYDYVRVYEGMTRHALDVTKCGSIREVLKLISTAEGKETKPKDPKVETWVTHVGKIEAWFDAEEKALPIEEWSNERREAAKGILKRLASIYRKL